MSVHFVSLQNCHIALYFGIKHVERSKNARYKLELKCLLLEKKELSRSSPKLCISEAGCSLLKSGCTVH